MKLALVSPTPVPPAFGGMDRLLEGLVEALRQRHPTDLVTIPFDERSREGVLQGYHDFYNLDLSAYDRVISYKAPAYMVQHPNQVLYLSHRLRVFYDLYQPGDAAHSRMRDMIHFMDNWALNKQRLPHIFTVGQTVSNRLIRFGNIASIPIHHPTTFTPLPPKTGEYFLSVGRLHPWKRVDLIIRSFRRTKVDCPLLIAGEGPHESELRELAKGDSRIQFVGKVSDSRLAELYASAMAVLFPPISEDMGLITFEAFMSGKPIITTEDSGEPALIIEEGKTGWIAEPTDAGLAKKLEEAWASRSQLESMGERCLAWMKPVTWDRLVDALLKAGDAIATNAKKSPERKVPTPKCLTSLVKSPGKIRLLVTDNQIIDPPLGGGRVRILELYRHMPEDIETVYIGAFDYPGPIARDQMLAPNFREILTPLTSPHFRLHNLLSRLTSGDATLDVTMPILGNWTPRYRRLLEAHLPSADLLIGAHPWMFRFFPETDKPIIYDSQNCEFPLKGPMLERSFAGRWIARKVYEAELLAIKKSQRVLACSDEDAKCFREFYQLDQERIVPAPNGVDCARITPTSAETRRMTRQRFDISRKFCAIFTGSNYLPNLEGAEIIIREVAPANENVDFLIAGGVGPMFRERYPDEYIPSNVHILGFIEPERLLDCYRVADFALNPMKQGSGTNIKMLDYLAAGLPIITSPKGARGIAGTSGEHWIEAEPNAFPCAVAELLELDEIKWKEISAKARELAEREYDWKRISARVADSFRELLVERREGKGRV